MFKRGDVVMVVRSYPCCGETPRRIGAVGVVTDCPMQPAPLIYRHTSCGHLDPPEVAVWLEVADKTVVFHHSMLKKLPPLAEDKDTEVTQHEPDEIQHA